MSMNDKALTQWTPMDLDELDQQERQIGFGQGGGQFFSFKEGKNVTRFLPGLHGRPAFIPMFKHFVKGASADGKPFTHACPLKMAKLTCVTCQIIAKLTRGTEADRKLADDIGVRQKVLANVLDRANPDAGPQVAELPQSVYKAVKEYSRTMGEDPTNPIKGFDFVIEKKGSGLNTEYTAIAHRKDSPLHQDARQMTDWLNEAADLGTYIVLPSEQDQLAKLAGTVVSHMLSGGSGRSANSGSRDSGVQRAKASAALQVDDDDLNY